MSEWGNPPTISWNPFNMDSKPAKKNILVAGGEEIVRDCLSRDDRTGKSLNQSSVKDYNRC